MLYIESIVGLTLLFFISFCLVLSNCHLNFALLILNLAPSNFEISPNYPNAYALPKQLFHNRKNYFWNEIFSIPKVYIYSTIVVLEYIYSPGIAISKWYFSYSGIVNTRSFRYVISFLGITHWWCVV